MTSAEDLLAYADDQLGQARRRANGSMLDGLRATEIHARVALARELRELALVRLGLAASRDAEPGGYVRA